MSDATGLALCPSLNSPGPEKCYLRISISMFHNRHVSLCRRSSRPQPVLVFQFILAIVFLALPAFSTSAIISVNVDPQTGSDFDACGVTIPCKSIFYAVTNISASIVVWSLLRYSTAAPVCWRQARHFTSSILPSHFPVSPSKIASI